MANLVSKEGQDDTSRLLAEIAKGLAEGITGVAASDRKDLILSLGHLFQRGRSGRFLKTLIDEWDQYREKGKIKDDYIRTEQHQECLQEMLDFLDKDSPDELRFSVLKKIFLVAATEAQSSRDSVLPQQYMRLCRALSGGEVLVLSATYHVAQHDFAIQKVAALKDSSASKWLAKIAEDSGLKYPELVEIHERNLIEKNLLTKRELGDRSGVSLGEHYRLTGLGYEICQFLESYEKNDMPNSSLQSDR
jgi:hypothetical protein